MSERGRPRTNFLCTAEDNGVKCTKVAHSKGLCRTHYQRRRTELKQEKGEHCSLCDNPVYAQGFCQAHYQRTYRAFKEDE